MTELRAALVTGGARRIGRAVVLELASRGSDVVIHYNGSRPDAEALAREARALGVQAETVQADLLDRDAARGLVDVSVQVLGKPLAILVNNASIFEYDTMASATPESWDRHMDSNLRAPFELIQAFARQAPEAGRDAAGERLAGAAVINIIDQRVLKPTPEFLTYTVSKMALWSLTRVAAQALAPDIRVNAIGPGPTLRGARQSSEHFEAQRRATILERGTAPAEICAALRYLLDAPGVTGQLICVDGGQHLGWRTPDVLGPE